VFVPLQLTGYDELTICVRCLCTPYDPMSPRPKNLQAVSTIRTEIETLQSSLYRIFELRILRKNFGPVQNKGGSWRIRMNYEMNELIENADTVRFIKSKKEQS